ncbi:MAG: lysophospholipid acyltransferase family protein [Planctomycetota bacterium]
MKNFRISPMAPKGVWERIGYAGFQGFFGLVLRTVYHMRRADTRPLPPGAVIVAANHRSFVDPGVLGAAVDRELIYMMNAKYYDIPMLNWFFRMARCIVVEDERDNRATLRAAKQVLDHGLALGIFPEGHISKDGTLQPAKPGIGWLARKTGAPVVPVHLSGTRETLPRSARMLRLAHISVRMGEPLSIADYPDGRAGDEAFARDVMAAIARLGGVPAPRE